jgi:hypothetical protein
VRLVLLGASAFILTACASVQIAMPGIGPKDEEPTRVQEREALSLAVAELGARPWRAAEPGESGIVNLIFGDASPGPRQIAEGYINGMKLPADAATATVRRDLERTLTDAWRVAQTGRDAVSSPRVSPTDLRMIEDAIVQTRRCRLVYTEALSLLSDETGAVERAEIRDVKKRFNAAILDLGKTANALDARIRDGVPASYADSRSAY